MPKKTGFTLVELLIAVSVIAILSAIGVTIFSEVTVKTRNNARKNDLKQIQQALELYYETNHFYPNPNSGVVGVESCAPVDDNFNQNRISNLLKQVPSDPKDKTVYYEYCFLNGKYTIKANLESPVEVYQLTPSI